MLKVDVSAARGDFMLEGQFEIGQGVSALVGPSGAGKSSMLRVISGLETPKMGRITLKDRIWFDDKIGGNLASHRRNIGMVFQQGLLLKHKSVLRNIELGARGEKVSDELLAQTGCVELLSRPVLGLSGGEQQRVMLARALVGRPALLLLDEPLSALDPASKEQMLELMIRLFPNLEIPIIYVTHAFEEAVRLANNFLRMENGKIVGQGGARDVLAHNSSAGQELGVSSVVEGKVIFSDGMAKVQLENQFVEVAAGELIAGDRIGLRLWARDLILAHDKPSGLSARNCLRAKIIKLREVAHNQVMVDVDLDGTIVRALVLSQTAKEMGLENGQKIYLVFKSASVEPLAALKL